jgi:GDP-L-fucose synthase
MRLADEKFSALLHAEYGPLINIGWGEDITIRELAETIADIVGFQGKLFFDPNKPDGTPRKLLDCSRLSALGWRPSIQLRAGLLQACQSFSQWSDRELSPVGDPA